jgi:hypothetical protein
MQDYISATERVSNPHTKWVKDWFKDMAVILTFIAIFIFLLTQPNGVI